MKPLSGLDGAFLHLETERTPMHVASLHLFDLPAGTNGADFHAAVKRQMRQRIHLAPVFERKLAPMPLRFANPVWVRDDAVDLDHHVQRVVLPAPGAMAELEACAARLHAELLDRDRPLWRLTIIDGLASGQAGYYIKVHHAAVDGQAGVLLARALFDLEPKPRAVPRAGRVRAEHPGIAELAAAALRHDAAQVVKLVRHLPDIAHTLAGLVGGPSAATKSAAGTTMGMGQNLAFGPHTALNVQITGERSFAGAALPLTALKQLAAAHGAKLNDIVLALASGALRRWLAANGGVPRRPLVAAMPVSLRAEGDTDYTTQATMTLVSLHTHVADPLRRLAAIRDAAGAAKALTGRAKAVLPTDFPSITVPWLLHGLATLYGRSGLAGAIPPIANLVVSNVPGPQVPLFAAGARMRSYWPLSIVEHGLGLNLTVLSYDGAMYFGFVAARDAVPEARALAEALQVAHDELVAKTKPAKPAKIRGTTR